jgi:hypothetical protein
MDVAVGSMAVVAGNMVVRADQDAAVDAAEAVEDREVSAPCQCPTLRAPNRKSRARLSLAAAS